MGEYADNRGNAADGFFFNQMGRVKSDFSHLFAFKGTTRPVCQRYREFVAGYGFTKMAFDAMQDSVAQAEKINQMYLGDFLFYLMYMVDKNEAEIAQDKYTAELERKKKK